MQELSPTVLVIDDDPDLRDSLGCLLRSTGLNTHLYEFIPDFLRSKRPEGIRLSGAGRKIARGERSGISARAGCSQHQAPDYFYYWIRRYPDVGTGDEGWRR